MVELNHRERSIKVKIVYYGPPVGGKTTNLQVLHRAANARRRGEMISINSAQDRTILFDLLPLKTPGFRGFDLRLQLLAVPGQAVYAATRRLVLKGADSLVFVANSALDRFEENLQSYHEMTHNLLSHHLDPSSMPLVFQYNKRDLPEILEIDALDRSLNARQAEAIPAVAIRGEGVLETFTAILAHTVADMARRYAILNVKEGTPIRQWAEQTVLELFGTSRLGRDSPAAAAAPPPPPPPPAPTPAPATPVASKPAAVGPPSSAEPTIPSKPSRPEAQPAVSPPLPGAAPGPSSAPASPRAGPGHVVVRAAPPSEDAGRAAPAFPEGRAIELVESYADASAQLGAAVEELRQERDTARQRLEDLRRAMQAAEQILGGTPFDAALAPVLACMAEIAGAEHAAFWVPQQGEPPRAVALRGLGRDPVLGSPGALRRVLEAGGREAPGFALAADDADLRRALDVPAGRFVAVLSVPFRTPGGLQGLGVFYYDPDSARPGADALDHLAEIPRALSATLELVAALQTVQAAERALELALTGSASLRGLEAVVRSLEELRDGLGEVRNHTDAPAWFVEQYLRFAPSLSGALEAGRSLLGFSRGEIRRDSVYLEDLLAELRTAEVTIEIDPTAEVIAADATLLRVALRAIADEVRARAGANSAPLLIRTSTSSDGVSISVQAEARRRRAGRAVNAGLGLGLARRIAELHGGTIEDAGPQAAEPIVLIVPAA